MLDLLFNDRLFNDEKGGLACTFVTPVAARVSTQVSAFALVCTVYFLGRQAMAVDCLFVRVIGSCDMQIGR